jgi:hypothetical protein
MRSARGQQDVGMKIPLVVLSSSSGGNVVRDANGQAKLPTMNEARRNAVDVTRLPSGLRRRGPVTDRLE